MILDNDEREVSIIVQDKLVFLILDKIEVIS